MIIIGNIIAIGGGRCPRSVPIGVFDYGVVYNEMSWANTAYEKTE